MTLDEAFQRAKAHMVMNGHLPELQEVHAVRQWHCTKCLAWGSAEEDDYGIYLMVPAPCGDQDDGFPKIIDLERNVDESSLNEGSLITVLRASKA